MATDYRSRAGIRNESTNSNASAGRNSACGEVREGKYHNAYMKSGVLVSSIDFAAMVTGTG
jgi:hypothetical protein